MKEKKRIDTLELKVKNLELEIQILKLRWSTRWSTQCPMSEPYKRLNEPVWTQY
jgi:hypothetical protein